MTDKRFNKLKIIRKHFHNWYHIYNKNIINSKGMSYPIIDIKDKILIISVGARVFCTNYFNITIMSQIIYNFSMSFQVRVLRRRWCGAIVSLRRWTWYVVGIPCPLRKISIQKSDYTSFQTDVFGPFSSNCDMRENSNPKTRPFSSNLVNRISGRFKRYFFESV